MSQEKEWTIGQNFCFASAFSTDFAATETTLFAELFYFLRPVLTETWKITDVRSTLDGAIVTLCKPGHENEPQTFTILNTNDAELRFSVQQHDNTELRVTYNWKDRTVTFISTPKYGERYEVSFKEQFLSKVQLQKMHENCSYFVFDSTGHVCRAGQGRGNQYDVCAVIADDGETRLYCRRLDSLARYDMSDDQRQVYDNDDKKFRAKCTGIREAAPWLSQSKHQSSNLFTGNTRFVSNLLKQHNYDWLKEQTNIDFVTLLSLNKTSFV